MNKIMARVIAVLALAIGLTTTMLVADTLALTEAQCRTRCEAQQTPEWQDSDFAACLAGCLSNPDIVVGGGISGGADAGQTDEMATQLFGESGVVTNIISVVIFIVGALCVIMLVWGGIQYILSAGDSGKVTSAKNTILYAVIGLIVCIVAYAVVQFVLVNLGGNGSSSSENSNSNENSNEG